MEQKEEGSKLTGDQTSEDPSQQTETPSPQWIAEMVIDDMISKSKALKKLNLSKKNLQEVAVQHILFLKFVRYHLLSLNWELFSSWT